MTSCLGRSSGHPLLDRLQEIHPLLVDGAAGRESSRQLAHEQVRLLAERGITTLRVPLGNGGPGGTLRDLFETVVDVASADSNLAQALRAHFSFVETLRSAPANLQRRWFPAILDGKIVGNATTERGTATPMDMTTTLRSQPDGSYLLNGRKHYSTGTLYSDYLVVLAVGDDGNPASVVVDTDSPGVTLLDDWTGMGQRTTASGTTLLDSVRVPAANLLARRPPDTAFDHLGTFRQLYLAAVLAGIGEAAAADARQVVNRTARPGPHSITDDPRTDPYVLEVLGDISSRAFAARAAVLFAAESLAAAAGGTDPEVVQQAAIDVAAAQAVITPSVLTACQQLFDTAGASALDERLNLNRHWRNARTIASHNPLAYKKRAVGQWYLDRTPPPTNGYF